MQFVGSQSSAHRWYHWTVRICSGDECTCSIKEDIPLNTLLLVSFWGTCHMMDLLGGWINHFRNLPIILQAWFPVYCFQMVGRPHIECPMVRHLTTYGYTSWHPLPFYPFLSIIQSVWTTLLSSSNQAAFQLKTSNLSPVKNLEKFNGFHYHLSIL